MKIERPPHVFMHRLMIPDFNGWCDFHLDMQVRNLKIWGNEGDVEVNLWKALGADDVRNIILHNQTHENMFRAGNGEQGYKGHEHFYRNRIKESDADLRIDIQGHQEKTEEEKNE